MKTRWIQLGKNENERFNLRFICSILNIRIKHSKQNKYLFEIYIDKLF